MRERDEVRRGVQRAAWRMEAGAGIAWLSLLLGTGLAIADYFALGVLLVIGGIGFGVWLRYFS